MWHDTHVSSSYISLSIWTSISECKVREFVFAPISPSKPYNVIYQPCSEKLSLSFYDPSVKTNYLELKVNLISIFLDWVILFVSDACASTQSNDLLSAKFGVSLGPKSILLKTLLFCSLHKYHKIHANWWSSRCEVGLKYM